MKYKRLDKIVFCVLLISSSQLIIKAAVTSTMTPVLKKYKAAAVNAEPGWFNLEESVRRTIHWINEAGEAGCKLIAFPELCMSTTVEHRRGLPWLIV